MKLLPSSDSGSEDASAMVDHEGDGGDLEHEQGGGGGGGLRLGVVRLGRAGGKVRLRRRREKRNCKKTVILEESRFRSAGLGN